MGTDKDTVLPLFFTALLFGISGAVLGANVFQAESAKLCRHTIQRHFGKTSEEAKALIEETRQWEEK